MLPFAAGLLAALTCVACGGKPATTNSTSSPTAARDKSSALSERPAQPVENEEQAIAAYERVLQSVLMPHLREHRPKVATHWETTTGDPAIGDSKGALRCVASEVRERVEDTLGPSEMDAILFGRLEDLGEQPCWEASHAIGFESRVLIIHAETGELLFAWWPPEG